METEEQSVYAEMERPKNIEDLHCIREIVFKDLLILKQNFLGLRFLASSVLL